MDMERFDCDILELVGSIVVASVALLLPLVKQLPL
jgi:hypothetical protein